MNDELKQKLRERGNAGLDLSPGDPVCKEALGEIERLETENAWLREEIERERAEGKEREKILEEQLEMVIKKQNENDQEITKLVDARTELLEIVEKLKDKKVSTSGIWY